MTGQRSAERDQALEGSDLALAALAVARRFAAGATLWCWAPDLPAHANHIAVEFVHPVIIGKPALPAVAVSDGGTDSLRAMVRSGDALVVVGSANNADLVDALRRARSWGATSVWIGAGDRPAAGAADHVLWIDGPADLSAYDGSFVLRYHLLWELTHVWLEHKGLLAGAAECVDGEVCITCSDQGRLAEVVAASGGSATVRTSTGIEDVDTSLVGPVVSGDLVLVHAGCAITVVADEA